MKSPCFKKSRQGVVLKLHRTLYPPGVLRAFKARFSEVGVSSRGAYWFLVIPGHRERDGLDVLDILLRLLKN